MPTYDVRFEASNDIAGANNRQRREVKEIIEYSLPTFMDKNNRSGTLVKKTLVQCYIAMFQCLFDICTQENLLLSIEHLNLDFEYAAHEAGRHFWLDVTIKGCQFHLAQGWYRKIQSLRLTAEYKSQESVVGQWLKCFFSV
jgi:hypothetical protein